MSRTIRTVMDYQGVNPRLIRCDDTKASTHGNGFEKRLRPYIRPDVPYKGKYERAQHPICVNGICHKARNTNPGSQIGVNNANRSLKNGLRQQLKRDLDKQLNDL